MLRPGAKVSRRGRTRLRLGDQKIKKKTLTAVGEELAQAIKRCERLGYWFAAVGSTRVVFDIMGLTL